MMWFLNERERTYRRREEAERQKQQPRTGKTRLKMSKQNMRIVLATTIVVVCTLSRITQQPVAAAEQDDELLFPDSNSEQQDNDYLNLISSEQSAAAPMSNLPPPAAPIEQQQHNKFVNSTSRSGGQLTVDYSTSSGGDEDFVIADDDGTVSLPGDFLERQTKDDRQIIFYSNLVGQTSGEQQQLTTTNNLHFHPEQQQKRHTSSLDLFLDNTNYDYHNQQQPHSFASPDRYFQSGGGGSNAIKTRVQIEQPRMPFAEPLHAQQNHPSAAAATTSGLQLSELPPPPMSAFKIGPQFIKEPPSFIHYLNSSDLIIPCSASGNPAPTISWWHKSGHQLETGSLLDKRYVRYDNSLVISAFKAPEFEPEIHSTIYRCQAANSMGTIVSRDVVINAVIDQDYEVSVSDQFVSVDNDALFKCQLAPQMRELFQVIGWLEDGQQLVSASAASAASASSSTGVNSNQLNWQQIQHLFGSSLSARNKPSEQQQQPTSVSHQRRRQQQQPQPAGQQQPARAFLLPDGQLYVARVQLRDANKSYRCQLRNQLNGRITLSSISGRLFVTDARETGAAPRIVESPKAISFGKLNEQLLLTCLAQGSPRPTVRWFRQQYLPSSAATINDVQLESAAAGGADSAKSSMDANEDQAQFGDWLELMPPASSSAAQANQAPNSTTTTNLANNNNNDNQQQQQKYLVSSDGNLLLLRSLQASDQNARFKCLVNNSFGAQQVETVLKLDLWSPHKLIELEPKVEFINNQQHHQPLINDNQQQQQYFRTAISSSQPPLNVFTLNCTIRRLESQPLLAIEWLKNGQQLYSISLAQFGSPNNHLNNYHHGAELINQTMLGLGGSSSSSSSLSPSIFDDPNQELNVIEFNQQPGGAGDQQDSSAAMDQSNSIDQQQQQPAQGEQRNNFLIVSSTLNKLHSQQHNERRAAGSRGGNSPNPWQSLRSIQRDTLLYQLHFAWPLRRADRGSFQCRAKLARTILHSTSQLLLKDNPPQFVETFPSQLIQTGNSAAAAATNARQQQQASVNQASSAAAASLKCVASGSPLPEISWTLSGFPVPESSRFRVGDYVTRDGLIVSFVNISSVQVEDGGLYECSATNDVGQLRHSGWLNVTGPAYVRSMPNVSAVAGNSLTIMCPVGGWPIEQISWFQNSTKLPLNHRQKLFPNGTLIINELNEVTDSGQYSCQAKSASSSSSSSSATALSSPLDELIALNHVHIQIKVPPLLEPFSFAKSLHRGQRYNIMCTVIRGDLPVSIRWLKDGRPILQQNQFSLIEQQQAGNNLVAAGDLSLSSSSSNNQREQQQQQLATTGIIAVKQLDPYSSTLTFASLQAQHRGQYTCEATNEAGRANQSSTLVIHVPPEWRIEPRDLSVTVGKTAVIDCQADGFPAARIEWRLSQDLFREPPSEFKPIISSLYMRVFENGSLIIYNTQRSDAGYYLCQANNGIGPGISRVIKLTVHVAAHFKTKIKTELVRLNQAAKLRCESIGDLPIEINWLKDKMPLIYPNGGGDEEAGQRYSLVRSQLQDGIVSELSIAETQRGDSALFTCITQNQFGSDDTNIQLIVQSEPDRPQEIRLHEYESRSVKISWLPGHSGNSPIVKYLIMYAPTTASNSNQLQQQFTNISIDGAESSLLLQGLLPLTEYQFQLLAINSIGSSRPLNEPVKFRTDDEAPNLPPLFVKAQAVSSKSLKVRWRVPERRTHYGSISGFYVGYKPLMSSHQNNNSNQQQQQQQEAAKASSPAQQQDTFVFKTIDFQAAATTTNLALADPLNKSSAASAQLIEQECQLNGLRRGQKYLVTVQPFNVRGAGPASEQIIAETWRFDVPDAPTLRMISRTTRSVHLAWRLASMVGGSKAPKLASGSGSSKPATNEIGGAQDSPIDGDSELANEPIFGFILTRRQISSSPTSNGKDTPERVNDDATATNSGRDVVELRLPADHMSQIVDNLTCGTRYQFTLAALNSVGASQPSEPLLIKTDGSPPVAPDRSSLLSMSNSSSVLINLGAWHDGSCPMYSFDILFKTSRSKKWSTLTNYQIAKAPPNAVDNNNATAASKQQQGSPIAQRSASSSGANNHHHHHHQQQQQHQPASSAAAANGTIVLDDLSQSVNYDLKIVATNEAGTTEALYTFNTNSANFQGGGLPRDQHLSGGAPADGGQFDLTTNNLVNELFGSGGQSNNGLLGPFIPFVLLLVLISLALSTGCILLARRRHASSSSCSLSISSASRSNQSASSNYYTTPAGTTTTQGGGCLADNNKSSATLNGGGGGSSASGSGTTTSSTLQMRKQQQQMGCDSSLRELDDVSPNTIQQFNLHHQGSSTLGHLHSYHHHLQQQQQQSIRLGDIYGAATMRRGNTQQQQGGELQQKSNYAYLTSTQQQQQRQNTTSSPQQTSDITSVLNGSETEMCLGASALNINNPNEEDQIGGGGDHYQQEKQLQQKLHSAGYYVAQGTLLLANKANNQQQQQLLLSQLANKSSTLPANCHQQIMQQLLQQQQISNESSSMSNNNNQQQQQQLLLNSLVANANLMQQQQPTTTTIDANDEEAAYIQALQQQQHLMDSIQHQQQVYATVKRGCPRLPRLCDYSTSAVAGYQCPGLVGQSAAPTTPQCCAGGGGGDPQLASAACFHHQSTTTNGGGNAAEMLLLNNNNICNAQQQQQPVATTTMGDYQQLQRQPQIN